MLRESPNTALAYNNLGTILQQRDQNQDAVGYFLRAIQLDSTYASAYNGAGLAYLNLASIRFGGGSCWNAGDTFGRTTKVCLTNLGWAYLEAGRAQAAADLLRTVVHDDPTTLNARLNLVEADLAVGNVAQADSMGRDLLRLAPGNLRAHLAMGKVLLRQGRNPEAWSEYRKARELDATSPLPLVMLISAFSNPPQADSMIRLCH